MADREARNRELLACLEAMHDPTGRRGRERQNGGNGGACGTGTAPGHAQEERRKRTRTADVRADSSDLYERQVEGMAETYSGTTGALYALNHAALFIDQARQCILDGRAAAGGLDPDAAELEAARAMVWDAWSMLRTAAACLASPRATFDCDAELFDGWDA